MSDDDIHSEAAQIAAQAVQVARDARMSRTPRAEQIDAELTRIIERLQAEAHVERHVCPVCGHVKVRHGRQCAFCTCTRQFRREDDA